MSSYPQSLDSYLPEDFNAEEAVNEVGGFEPIPDGDYQGVVKRVELKQTRNGEGTMLSVGVQITGPKYAGKWVWQNINIKNRNATAQKIGLAEFASFLLATGFSRPPRDTALFIDKDVTVRVVSQDFNGQRENRIKAIKPPANGAPRSAAAFQQPAAAAPAAPAAAPKKNPWG